MIQCRQSLQLDSFSTTAVPIKTRTNVCHGITAHTLWRFHDEQQVNTESFQVLFTCQVTFCCHVHVLPKMRHSFGGVVNFCLSLLSAYFLAVLEIP